MTLTFALLAGLVGTSAAAAVNLTSLGLDPELLRRDPVPNKLPQCATYADLKWQPGLDFDRDSCYNTPAIGANGFLNPGMGCGKSPQGGCRDEIDLNNNNVYSRSRCNNGWCAHIYAYYFEKDFPNVCTAAIGHRHDWEHVVVWTKNDKAIYVATSAHGEYYPRKASDVAWDGTHPKIVYHLEGQGTHAMRFASKSEKPENHKKTWFRGTLVSYYGFPSVDLRNKMMRADWGKASIDLRDSRIEGALNKNKLWIGNDVKAFQSGKDAPDGHNSPGRINGCGVSN
ncbi:secreted protein [Podospora australis]|uniref:Secreted protein n=1 Tax=Podospora australis TaxID=1536484 RepID=A0AAN6WJ78_9PEZI|nr:secreted protein [Podospora australis]